MEYAYPSYYTKFQCTGGNCPDTCCAGWEITIDDRSLMRYRNYSGAFGNRLANSVDFEKKSFRQYGRRCTFLNENNLCDIYIEAGKDMMCRTCRMYPRHVEEYENIRELSLSLSCPEAARLILSCDGMEMRYMEKLIPREDYEDFDGYLFSKLLDARQVLFRIIQDQNYDIPTRMMMLLSLAHHLQRCVSSGKLSEMEQVYRQYLKEGAGARCRSYMMAQTARSDRFQIMKAVFRSLHKLEVLSEAWPGIIRHCERELFGRGRGSYEQLKKWQMPSKLQERLLTYFIYVYFAGAVYDRRPYVKVKLAVVSTMIIADMLCVAAIEKGEVRMEDCIDTAHRYAREIEHSDVNLDRLEEMLGQWRCFHILNLAAALNE